MIDKVAAVLVLRHDGAALLQHRDDKAGLRHAGMWVPPGGHAESDEPMFDCARRELREETEYDTSDLRFLMSFDDTVKGWPAYQLTIYWCWYDGVQSVACHEGQGLAFIKRSMAANYPIPPPIINVWDAALAAAGVTTEESTPNPALRVGESEVLASGARSAWLGAGECCVQLSGGHSLGERNQDMG